MSDDFGSDTTADSIVEPIMVSLADDCVGERLDRAVLTALSRAGIDCTRSALGRSFSAGLVTIDGDVVKPGATVRRPVAVAVGLLEARPLSAAPEDLPLAIVYEDEHVLVVDKAAGMPVHPGPGHPGGTLVNAVLHHLAVDALPVLPGNPSHRPGLVHRIDRDTSGLLVLARQTAAQEALAEQFRDHTVERSYVAIVRGVPSWTTKKIDTTHGRDPADRRRFAPVPGAKRRAVSTFKVIEELGHAAVLRCRLSTGRTHQIRMHARHVGHPLLADALYGRESKVERVRDVARALGRHALHAATLGFRHPASGDYVRFESPLPADLADAIATLRNDSATPREDGRSPDEEPRS